MNGRTPLHGKLAVSGTLAVITLKKTWADPHSPSGSATIGGFPRQMGALAPLFDAVHIVAPRLPGSPPPGAVPLTAPNMRVTPLGHLPEAGPGRKAAWLAWLPRQLPAVWRAIADADAVHTPVPGDVATLGLLIALLQRKPLFVRHCSLWGQTFTPMGRFLLWLLERIAGGRNVVFATGGADRPPSSRNPAIDWIFSTSLDAAQWDALTPAPSWQPGSPLRLVAAGRLEPVKNSAVLLHALAALRDHPAHPHLALAGDGTQRPALERLAADLDLADRVTFHGNLAHDAVLALMQQSHLFLLPSHFEGFPKAALEAMACGLPVVATAVSVLPHLIGTTNGRLLPEPTAAAVATAIAELAADPAQLARLGANARAASAGYTLEAWRDCIGAKLSAQWGRLHP